MNKMDVDHVFTHEEMVSAMQGIDENDKHFFPLIHRNQRS